MKADIIQMAREAGLHLYVNDITEEPYAQRLQHFAKLIAGKCADIADIAEPYKADDLIRKHFGVDDEPRTGAT